MTKRLNTLAGLGLALALFTAGALAPRPAPRAAQPVVLYVTPVADVSQGVTFAASYEPETTVRVLRVQAEPGGGGILQRILEAIFSAIVGGLAIYVATQLAKINALVDNLPGIVLQLITIAEAFIATKLTALLGVPFPTDLLGGLSNPVAAQTALTALFAWFIHRIFKTG